MNGIDQAQVRMIKKIACPPVVFPSIGLEIALNLSNAMTALVAAPPIPEKLPRMAYALQAPSPPTIFWKKELYNSRGISQALIRKC